MAQPTPVNKGKMKGIDLVRLKEEIYTDIDAMRKVTDMNCTDIHSIHNRVKEINGGVHKFVIDKIKEYLNSDEFFGEITLLIDKQVQLLLPSKPVTASTSTQASMEPPKEAPTTRQQAKNAKKKVATTTEIAATTSVETTPSTDLSAPTEPQEKEAFTTISHKRKRKVLIKGIPLTISPDTIQQELTDKGFICTQTARMITTTSQKPMKMIITNFSGPLKDLCSIKNILETPVTIEPFNSAKWNRRKPRGIQSMTPNLASASHELSSAVKTLGGLIQLAKTFSSLFN